MSSNIVKHSEYDIEKLTFNPLTNPKKKSLQSILLPSYDGGRGPLIQLPFIYQPLFLKLPLNQKNPETKELTEGFFKKLDDKLNTEEFRETVLGGKKTNTHTNR